MKQCAFRFAGSHGIVSPTGPQCRAPGTHRVLYGMGGDSALIPDHRLYCEKHAEQYANTLRKLACITAVSIVEEK